MRTDQVEGGASVAGLRDQLELGVSPDHPDQPLAKDRVIVGQEDADAIRRLAHFDALPCSFVHSPLVIGQV